jgi:hypothetical protein
MKLRTTIEKVQADGYEALRHDLEHDALAAHALLQAIDEWTMAPAIKRRADELMREWTGEVG